MAKKKGTISNKRFQAIGQRRQDAIDNYRGVGAKEVERPVESVATKEERVERVKQQARDRRARRNQKRAFQHHGGIVSK